MDISIRSTELERMDAPDLDKKELQEALTDINLCNRWLGGVVITRKAVKQLMQRYPKKSYTILDVGCGDGYMLRQLAKRLGRSGTTFNFVGIDINATILDIAKQESRDFSNIQYYNLDVLTATGLKCDILICTLMLHHLEEESIPRFLEKFAALAKVGVVINDLERSPLAHFLFKTFSFFFLTSPVAKNDGLVSIRRGFRKYELKHWAGTMKKYTHKIQWKLLFRYLWIIQPGQ
ncbi:MAG: methyltransferase domain-containing protein [Bacteroidota bacterium]